MITFATQSQSSEFMKVLKARVNASLHYTRQKATKTLWIKTAVILSWFFISYSALYCLKIRNSPAIFLLMTCVSLGLAIACVGFNVFHDSIHGTFSNQKWMNQTLAVLCCSVAGPSQFIWRHKHNYLHHQFPNIQGWDDDLDTREGLRLSPRQTWSKRYTYQHFYAPFIYALTTMEWIFVRDFIRYFSGRMNSQQLLPQMSRKDHLEFWFSKTIYFLMMVILLVLYFGVFPFVVGFLVVNLVASIMLAGVFQLAHVMQESQFPLKDPQTGKIPMSWAELQLTTTVNFSPRSSWIQWYTGGLNFQIEHHLLPGISHDHYEQLSPIVKATALEFGYPYHSIESHWGALADHFKMLKKLATQSG